MKLKKKKNDMKIAEQNIKILKSGKIKVKKGQKISLDPYIENSVENTICSRSTGIISKEDVVVSNGDVSKTNITANLSSMRRTADMLSRTSTSTTYTITHVINKKESGEIFDFLDDSIVGILLRTSTLATIYKKIKDEWLDLNDEDKTSFFNVLYIPNIFVFLDEDGKIKKKPYKVNLLLVAIPTLKHFSEIKIEGIDEVDDSIYTKKIVDEITDIAIKCGAKNLIVAPYCHKVFLNDPHYTAELWKDATSSGRIISHISSIDFAVNDDDLYIIFSKNLLQLVGGMGSLKS